MRGTVSGRHPRGVVSAWPAWGWSMNRSGRQDRARRRSRLVGAGIGEAGLLSLLAASLLAGSALAQPPPQVLTTGDVTDSGISVVLRSNGDIVVAFTRQEGNC